MSVYVCVSVICLVCPVPQAAVSKRSSTAAKSKVLLKRKNVVLALVVSMKRGVIRNIITWSVFACRKMKWRG